MKSPLRILTVFHDPGAGQMMLPVLEALHKTPGVQMKALASTFLAGKFEKRQIPFEILPSSLSAAAATKIVDDFKPDVILTGTSWGANAEQTFRNIAFEKQIASFSVVDYWASYAERWSGAHYPITACPEKLFVVDEMMKQEMAQAGFPAQALIVAGHPYLEELRLQRKAPVKQDRPSKNISALFLSEPLRTPSEKDNLTRALERLQKWIDFLTKGGQSVSINIKFHPKETPSLSEHWGKLQNADLKLAKPDLVLPDDFEKFDFVLGFHTVGLLEAAALGRPTLSFPVREMPQSVRHAFAANHVFIIEKNADIESSAISPAPTTNMPAPQPTSKTRILNTILGRP